MAAASHIDPSQGQLFERRDRASDARIRNVRRSLPTADERRRGVEHVRELRARLAGTGAVGSPDHGRRHVHEAA